MGIETNEKASTSAKLGPFVTCLFGGISSQDLTGYFKVRTREDCDDCGIVVNILRIPSILDSESLSGISSGGTKAGKPSPQWQIKIVMACFRIILRNESQTVSNSPLRNSNPTLSPINQQMIPGLGFDIGKFGLSTFTLYK